jgi:hypothetical protein
MQPNGQMKPKNIQLMFLNRMKKILTTTFFVLLMTGLCFSQLTNNNLRLKPVCRTEFYSKVIGFGFIVATSFTLDEFVRKEIRQNHSEALYSSFDIMNNAGRLEFSTIVPLLYCGGLILKDEKLKRTSCISLESLILAGATTSALKYTTGRARPYNNKGAFFFDPFPANFNNDFLSLPSGHSAVAWSVITPYAEEYSRWLYIIPVSVSAARIYKDQHWLSDVVFGGGLGFIAGWYLVHKPSKKISFTGNSFTLYL